VCAALSNSLIKGWWKFRMGLKCEILALAFGMLVILVTFGDSHLARQIGNLDIIFGHTFWRLLDVMYPLLSISVFLLYGREKGGIKINPLTIGTFLSYIIALALINVDDVALVLNLSIMPSRDYWIAIEWFYPVYSVIAFFIFGKANQLEKLPFTHS
jgi:hypothetical protein